MVFFIDVLRALAACLITNAHYTGIYPNDIIANGGLIGDVIFFAVSGYCLFTAQKKPFPQWYGKRIYRIYLPVLVMTLIFLLIGQYSLEEHNAFWWLIYPTCYHFVASIIILYIPFYFITRIDVLRRNVPLLMAGVAIAYILIYLIFYDRSYYHIDKVREPMIRFLFMESMLLGAHFKQHDSFYRNRRRIYNYIGLGTSFVIYFGSKLLFSRRASLANWQILNQLCLMALLYFIFAVFAGLDKKLVHMPKWIKAVIEFIKSITLEIYLVKDVLIAIIRERVTTFPINWFVVTASIIAAAASLHLVCYLLYKLLDRITAAIKAKGSAA